VPPVNAGTLNSYIDVVFIFFEMPEGIMKENNSRGIAAKMNFFIIFFYKDTISPIIICKDSMMFVRTLPLKKIRN
jgi:hypothetical protein